MMEIFDIKKYQRWEIQLFVENDGFVRLVMQISSKKAIQNIKKKRQNGPLGIFFVIFH